MKKLLALVLALVMSMSLVTISNAAFKDADKIDYKEAVDVMNAVGVFIGDEKGNFNAKENLTREQAAKIITYLDLGEKAAEALNGTGAYFTDVAASNWAAGYIEYCAQAGYVNGIGDGKFDPNGKLTGLQFAKMLLTVLGYDVNVEKLVGSDWAINAAKLGSKNDLYKGLSKASSAVLTREEAAQMALNALQATMVEYDTKGTDITIGGGTSITVGASKAEKVTKPNTNKNYSKIDDAKDGSNYYVELGEELYEGKLVKNENGQKDDLGRKAIQWTYKNDEIGTYGKKADETYTLTSRYEIAQGKYADLISVLQDEDFTDNDKLTFAKLDGKQVYVNGKGVSSNDASVKNALMNAAKGGTTVELYYNDDDKDAVDYVVILNYSIDEIKDVSTKLTKDQKKDGATSKIKVGGKWFLDNDVVGFDSKTYVEDAYLLYIVKNGTSDEIAASQIAEEITGKTTAVKGADKATVGGTQYKFVNKLNDTYKGVDIDVDDEGSYYLNVAGQIAAVDTDSNSDNYAFVYKIDKDTGINSDGVNATTYTAYYVAADGTKASADIATEKVDGVYYFDGYKENGNKVAVPDDFNGVWAFSINGDKEFVRETPKDTISTETKTIDKTHAAGTDSDTQFIFAWADGNKVKTSTATGYKNASVVSKTVYTVKNSDGDYLYVFVGFENGSLSSDVQYAVVTDSKASKTKDGDDTIYTYDVIINGEESTLSFKGTDPQLTKGAAYAYELDGKNVKSGSLETLKFAKVHAGTKNYVEVKDAKGDYQQYNLDDDVKAIYTVTLEYKTEAAYNTAISTATLGLADLDSVMVSEGADIDNESWVAYKVDGSDLDVLFVVDFVD